MPFARSLKLVVVFALLVASVVGPGAAGAHEAGQDLTPSSALPVRAMESVPNAIRDDGVDSFRLEVQVEQRVQSVILRNVHPTLDGPSPDEVALRDDGVGVDRVAGDLVYTAGPFRRHAQDRPVPLRFLGDLSSPAGLDILDVGNVHVTGLDGTTAQFARPASVGLVAPDVPTVVTTRVSSDIAVSPHLINVRTSGRHTQIGLRGDGSYDQLSEQLYDVLPDAFDMLVLFSTNRAELQPFGTGRAVIRGINETVQVDHRGTRRMPYDASQTYGSDGRLLGVSALDAYEGLRSGLLTHEILHQWGAFVDPSLGLSRHDGAHWLANSSMGSLLGGYEVNVHPGGGWWINCDEGGQQGTRAPAIDLYFMGLVPAEAVPPMYVYRTGATCGEQYPIYEQDIVRRVTIEDIQRVHGPRTPGPDRAQRSFALGFVAESHGRMLTPVEMTFYDVLARHYTSEVPADQPAPVVGANWASIDRYFGHGVEWGSGVPQPAPGVPGRPEQVWATAADASVRVSWAPPRHLGSGPILDYTVTASPGGRSVTVRGTSATVEGLTNGHSYTFSVQARNAQGVGKASLPSLPARPAGTPRGERGWLVDSRGAVFPFGDAPSHGSTGNIRLNRPIVGMAPTPTGGGYWLVASDGGIFAFGDATFHGSTGSIDFRGSEVVAITASRDGKGYLLYLDYGGMAPFGSAPETQARSFHGWGTPLIIGAALRP